MNWVPPGVTVNTPDHSVLARAPSSMWRPGPLVIGMDRCAVFDTAQGVVVEYNRFRGTDGERFEDGLPLVEEQFGTKKVCDSSLGGGDLRRVAGDVIIERASSTIAWPAAIQTTRRAGRVSRPNRLTVWSSTRCRTSCAVPRRSCSASARTGSA